MKILRGILCCLLLCSPLVYAARSSSPDQELSSKLEGSTVLLRGMEMGSKLKFDAQGAEVGQQQAGSFANSAVTINHVHLSNTTLDIKGTRGVLFLDTTSQAVSVTDVHFIPIGTRISITIARDPDNSADLMAALRKVFAFSVQDALEGKRPEVVMEDLATIASLASPPDTTLLPPNWRKMPPALIAGAYTVGTGVTPPRLVQHVDPVFPARERAEHIQGLCVLRLLVETNGLPSHIRVRRSDTQGTKGSPSLSQHDFDVAAITAVSQYRFKPAIYQGKPVPVLINVEVNFRIY